MEGWKEKRRMGESKEEKKTMEMVGETLQKVRRGMKRVKNRRGRWKSMIKLGDRWKRSIRGPVRRVKET